MKIDEKLRCDGEMFCRNEAFPQVSTVVKNIEIRVFWENEFMEEVRQASGAQKTSVFWQLRQFR